MKKYKIAIFIPAYKAATTLISVIERIPSKTKIFVREIYIFDDCSPDNTYYVGLGYKHESKIKKFNIYKNKKNLGYGGNQKLGYNYAIKRKYDIAVMLHGDAQYAPEYIPKLIKPLIENKADMVFGSRMVGNPLNQGMPLWKYLGNRFLTFFENRALNMNLSEYHSGFRAYNLHALKEVQFEDCPDDYGFDTDIIIKLVVKKKRIAEISIPTHYGPESHQISFTRSLYYGYSIFKSLLKYKLNKN